MIKNNLPKEPPRLNQRRSCRLCLSSGLLKLFSLSPTPPAEWYFPKENQKANEICFPLDLFICKNCSHVQILDVIDPEALFSNYFYQTQTSPGLITHFEGFARVIYSEINLTKESIVVDIGSNDGTLLSHFQKLECNVIGIEPSKGLAAFCNNKGIYTINSFLNIQSVNEVLSNFGPVDLVTANNVFAHNDDLRGMAECIALLLKDGGVFVFEVSSLLHTMTGLVFDYIYHEHLSYHSLISLQPFLTEFSLQIYDVDIINTKGGSYRVYAKKSKNQVLKTDRLQKASKEETKKGIDSVSFYKETYNQIQEQKKQLRNYLDSLPADAKIVGYGASATVTTLVYEYDLFEYLQFLVDDNEIRHGCFLPGTNIEVRAPVSLSKEPPTHILLLAWRFADIIIERIRMTVPDTVEFIVPLPNLKILYNKGAT